MPLGRLCADLAGPKTQESVGANRYAMRFADEYNFVQCSFINMAGAFLRFIADAATPPVGLEIGTIRTHREGSSGPDFRSYSTNGA